MAQFKMIKNNIGFIEHKPVCPIKVDTTAQGINQDLPSAFGLGQILVYSLVGCVNLYGTSRFMSNKPYIWQFMLDITIYQLNYNSS